MNNKFQYLSYPNPRFRREKFTLLNGEWNISYLKNDRDEIREILVPFPIESKKSGIFDIEPTEKLFYERKFNIEEIKEYILHFEGVDYEAIVIINDQIAYLHKGAYSSFSFPIKRFIKKGENTLALIVTDSFSKSQLRGKQRTRPENYECRYTQYTGIYKDVYLEEAGDAFIKNLKVRGDKNGKVSYSFELNQESESTVTILYKGKEVFKKSYPPSYSLKDEIYLKEYVLYSSNSPELYDIKITSRDDEVSSYFGFITIEAKNRKIYINDEETYLKLILNQGYYYQKLVSGETSDVLFDLNFIKEVGFNGIRVHQKQESNAFYYIADVLGLYLWSEIPSAYEFSDEMKEEYERELVRIINQNYNSPSIITYVLFNESWGIPLINEDEETQNFVNKMKEVTKNEDPYRFIVLNDGWFNMSNSDLTCLHEYEQDANKFLNEYKDENAVLHDKIINKYGKAFAKNNSYQNQPVIISEFGGASLSSSSGWGYGESRKDIIDYEKQLASIFKTIYSLPYLSGFCYTQLTDVEQETNGLLYENRELKLPIETIKKIIGGNYEG